MTESGSKPEQGNIRHSGFGLDSSFRFVHWSLVLAHLLVIGVWSLGFSVRPVVADDGWVMTTSDFVSQRIDLISISDDGAVVSVAGQQRLIGFDMLFRLERTDKPTATRSDFALELVDNQRLTGQPVGIEDENLIWQNPTLGNLRLPLRLAASISRENAEPGPADEVVAEDVIKLANGDSVSGIITNMDPKVVSLQQSDGNTVNLPLNSVTKVIFAAADRQPLLRRIFCITLLDGSLIYTPALQMSEGKLSLRISDREMRSLPMSAVASIEQINGPVIWLSLLQPVEVVTSSLFGLSWPPRMDRAVDGGPIRFGQRVYSRGIGVHSYCRMTFTLDPAWRTFRTQYAIAGDLPYAHLTVRIRLDGQTVHERTDFRSGTLAPPVVIDLGGHRQLTLEVDYGRNYDVQDRFNWIEPAFLTTSATADRAEPAEQ